MFCILMASRSLGPLPAQDFSLDIPVRVEGRVVTDVEQRMASQRFTLGHVSIDGHAIQNRILVQLPLYPVLTYGQIVSFSCTLKRPEPIENFRYDRYLAARGIVAVCWQPSGLSISEPKGFNVFGAILALKRRFVGALEWAVPEPSSSFLAGLIFGGSSGLAPDLQDAFSKTGLSHILAASGFNVSLLTAAFYGWAAQTRLGRRRAILLTAFGLLAYVVMAGASPSILRAALMALVALIGLWIQRRAVIWNLLLLAASILLFFQPGLVLWDPGFQLSFLATAALFILTPRFEPIFRWLPERFGIRTAVVSSAAVSLLTLPVVLWHFGTVPVFVLFTNAVVLPCIPILMALGAIAILTGIFVPVLAPFIGTPAWAGSYIVLRFIEIIGSFPFAQAEIPFPRFVAVICIPIIMFIVWKSHSTSDV